MKSQRISHTHLQFATANSTSQFLRQESVESNLFELYRTEQKSAMLKIAKEYVLPTLSAERKE